MDAATAAAAMEAPEYDRITVWQQTKAYFAEDPEYGSQVLTGLPSEGLESFPRHWGSTNVEFYNEDCVEVAVRHNRAGMNPMLLNMADWEIAGGCVNLGSAAQEEELFRRSNYFKHLSQDLYPLKELDTVISKNVKFIRRGQAAGYVRMDADEYIDCVAAPAVCFPQIDRNTGDMLRREDALLMEAKIKMLLLAAATSGNDVLVASAWGCGAFGCPSRHIGRIFRAALDQCKGFVKQVSFAILGPNMAPFQEGFFEAGPWQPRCP